MHNNKIGPPPPGLEDMILEHRRQHELVGTTEVAQTLDMLSIVVVSDLVSIKARAAFPKVLSINVLSVLLCLYAVSMKSGFSYLYTRMWGPSMSPRQGVAATISQLAAAIVKRDSRRTKSQTATRTDSKNGLGSPRCFKLLRMDGQRKRRHQQTNRGSISGKQAGTKADGEWKDQRAGGQ